MIPNAMITIAAVIVFAIGFVALMLPRIHGGRTDIGSQTPAFAAMWAAIAIGSVKGGVLAFFVISLVAPGIGCALALTMPRMAAVVVEVLSVIGTCALLGMVVA